MTESTQIKQPRKRFRSPPYPALGLGRAVERAAQLHKIAQHHEVGVATLQEAWEMKSAEGRVWRTAAALIQYGLLTDSGTGKARKFKVTDIGRRVILDSDPNSTKRKEALNTVALKPMIHKELWDKFGAASNVSDSLFRTHLTVDRVEANEAPYSENSANEVIETYRKTLDYSGLANLTEISGQEKIETDAEKIE
ncbi:MAG: hypothetical protein F4233_15150, partial [Rhodospirillaceae bacterium]|nr:hypothetical protein [Rhodospirillaceae bacterium]